MALINSKISPLSCFASTNPNSLPKFLVSKFHGTVASSSPANTTKRSSPSNVYLPVSNYLRRFDHKISIKHPKQDEFIKRRRRATFRNDAATRVGGNLRESRRRSETFSARSFSFKLIVKKRDSVLF
ncbi:hypothetical protein Bca52824_059815 [Brassica carinata]|uniref:Uncharacterized protein n=1 Tax=Brassica carinata TaxID=52824 RepID=A0A8X7UF17_BRACI|nr:hypothetical protein Bca52824_059815 [Brassica carinata]